jgi:hypothetical protein
LTPSPTIADARAGGGPRLAAKPCCAATARQAHRYHRRQLCWWRGAYAEHLRYSALGGAATPGIGETAGAFFSRGAGTGPFERIQALRGQLAPIQQAVDAYKSAADDPKTKPAALNKALVDTLARIDALGPQARASGRDVGELKCEVLALGTAVNDARASQEAIDAINGKGLSAELAEPKAAHKVRDAADEAAKAWDRVLAAIKRDAANFKAAEIKFSSGSDLDGIVAGSMRARVPMPQARCSTRRTNLAESEPPVSDSSRAQPSPAQESGAADQRLS